MYYGILTASVILFGIQFLFNERYQKASGSGLGNVMLFTLTSSLAGIVCLFFFNGPTLDCTPFTLLLASASAISGLLYSFCSLKAFSRVNLSLYSLFAMLGGMMLPFVVGILFYNEPLTLGKGVCVALIVVALALTVKRGGGDKWGWIYCAGVFVLNGLSGVLSKLYQDAPYAKVSSAAYSIWIAIISVVLSGIVLLIVRKQLSRPSARAMAYALGCGAFNKVGNYLLLIALAVLPASLQYPFVTGGVMVVTTLLAYLTPQKPSRRELASVALSFLGILALVLIP